MGLNPGDMHARIIDNLAAKTGHPLDHWLDLLEATDGEKPAKPALLKGKHGVGHHTAIAILREHMNDVPWRDGAALERDLFAGLDAAGQDTLQGLKNGIAALGDVETVPCKTYLGFRDGRQFAVIRPGRSGGLELGLALDAGHDAALSEAKGFGSARITAKLAVTDVAQAVDFAKAAQIA